MKINTLLIMKKSLALSMIIVSTLAILSSLVGSASAQENRVVLGKCCQTAHFGKEHAQHNDRAARTFEASDGQTIFPVT